MSQWRVQAPGDIMASSTCFSGLVEFLRTFSCFVQYYTLPCSVPQNLIVQCVTSCISAFLTFPESKQGVKDVVVRPGTPASDAEISSWEKVRDGYNDSCMVLHNFNFIMIPVIALL